MDSARWARNRSRSSESTRPVPCTMTITAPNSSSTSFDRCLEHNLASPRPRSQRRSPTVVVPDLAYVSASQARARRAQQRIKDVGAVVDAKLIGDGQQQSVGGGDCLILGELLDELPGFSGVGLAEARLAAVDEPDLVL